MALKFEEEAKQLLAKINEQQTDEMKVLYISSALSNSYYDGTLDGIKQMSTQLTIAQNEVLQKYVN